MQPEEMIGKTIGHYRVVRPLGTGSTSTVFVAEDINLKRDVALKLFQPRAGETQDFLRRFAREARVVAQLDHPNIVPVYEYGEDDDNAYLVMPHMTGGSLRDRLLAQKTLPPRETVDLISPILQALQYAHNRGLIHRDIKPGNILFKADGTPVLSDFGLVKITIPPSSESTALFNDTASMTGHAIAGTPDYMSPEQITGNVTPISDIYSIGVVLYEMLTGERPFNADNYMAVLMKQMYERPRPLHDLNPQISPALEAVVLQTLEKEAAKRIQRPEDLRQALAHALAEPIDTMPDAGGAATISTWPTVAHGALRPQQGNEHTLNADILSPPVKAAKQSESQRLYNQTAPPVVADGKIRPKRRIMLLLALTLFLVALLLVGGLGTALLAPQLLGFGKRANIHLSPTNTPGTTHTLVGTPAQGGGSTGGITTVTQNVPATTTTCPSTGTARAAVLAPLVLGSHQNLVYIVNEFNPSAYGTLKRRDVNVPDLKATEIVKMPNVYISWAQVSRDGQWILFTARLGQQDQLRMVRVDGQGLQTLYCAPVGNFILGSQWSFNQQSVIFDAGAGGVVPSVYQLTLNDGTLETVMTPQGNIGYLPRTWLDATHVYMVGFLPQARDAAFQNVYLLDLQKGANQPESNLQQVVASTQLCMSFDTSFEVKQLYESTCNGDNAHGFNGPSSVTVQDAHGGVAKEIFTSQSMAITMVRAINQTQLLLMVKNTTGNTAQNGLWRVNIDGTNLVRLSSDAANTQSLCPFSQYAWSNTSFDNNFYALQSNQQNIHSYGMFYGALAGGDPTQFADIRDGTQLFLVGWTTM